MKTLELDEAAGNFAQFVEEVSLRRESFKIVKAGIPCAYLIPAGERRCNSHELAEDLEDNEMSVEDRRALAATLRKGRRVLKPLRNPRA
jgi:antitoxin (DNA-binding transcriptional repressor) of toxin-antitoxin stability system